MSDLAQQRRTVRVLELLDLSQAAHAAEDATGARAAFDQAGQVDATATAAIVAGMKLGEIPRPSDAEWPEYLAAQQGGLATAEADENGGRCELTELRKSECDHCRRPGQRADPQPDTEAGAPFEARYPGVCAACDMPFYTGATIAAHPDGGWIGPECLT